MQYQIIPLAPLFSRPYDRQFRIWTISHDVVVLVPDNMPEWVPADTPEHTFSNVEGFRRYVVVHGKTLDEGRSKAQSYAVHRVPASAFNEINKTGLTGANLFYDYDTKLLVLILCSLI